MSQAGLIDIESANPQVPTLFIANVGQAVPIANTIELLGEVIAAAGVPFQSVASGNTVTYQVQYASAVASTDPSAVGLASFSSGDFNVDANGFVSLSATGGQTNIGVDAFIAPGTNPVVPNGMSIITITGGQIAAGSTSNVIETNSVVANQLIIQIQRSSAQASTTIGANGVAHFNSNSFTVDGNGFVSISGSTVGQTITGDTGGAISPTLGNWNILGTSTAAGTIPVQTSGTGSTLTIQVQKAQAIASTNATNVGLSAFNSTYFTVDANGFVSVNGSHVGQTITGSTGGALSPTAGNWTFSGGTTSISFSGSGSTLTLTGVLNVSHGGTGNSSVTVYAPICGGTATTGAYQSASTGIATPGFVLTSNGSSALPSFKSVSGSGAITTITGNSSGAEVPTSGGNFNILGSGSITIVGSTNTETVQLTGLTNHAVLVGAGTDTITKVGPSSTTGSPLLSAGSSSDPIFSTSFTIVDSNLTANLVGNSSSIQPTFTVQNTATSGGGHSSIIAATAHSGSVADTGFFCSGQYDIPQYWNFGMTSTSSPYANAYNISYSNAQGAPEAGVVGVSISPTGVVLIPSQDLQVIRSSNRVEALIHNSLNSADSVGRITLSTDASGGLSGCDAYIFMDTAQGSGGAYQAGVQSSTSTYQIQFNISNTHTYMDGTAGLSMNNSGIVNFPIGIQLAGGTTLSNYSEGTFTPTMIGSSTAGTTTYTSQVGNYTRIGNLVTVFISIAGSGATGTGNATFGNLPFTILNGVAPIGSAIVFTGTGATWAFPASTTSIAFRGTTNTVEGTIWCSGTAGANTALQMANAAFAFQLTLTYQV